MDEPTSGMTFGWGDRGECTVVAALRRAVYFRTSDGRLFKTGKAHWLRMAVKVAASADTHRDGQDHEDGLGS